MIVLKICHHYELLQYHLNVAKLTDKPVESISKCHFNRGGSNNPFNLRNPVHLEANPVTSHQTLLAICLHVVIVVLHMPGINALLTGSPASNVTELVILHQCATVPVLPRIQGNLTGFVIEVGHPRVKDLLQDDKSMKQQRCQTLQLKLTRNMT